MAESNLRRHCWQHCARYRGSNQSCVRVLSICTVTHDVCMIPVCDSATLLHRLRLVMCNHLLLMYQCDCVPADLGRIVLREPDKAQQFDMGIRKNSFCSR